MVTRNVVSNRSYSPKAPVCSKIKRIMMPVPAGSRPCLLSLSRACARAVSQTTHVSSCSIVLRLILHLSVPKGTFFLQTLHATLCKPPLRQSGVDGVRLA